MMSSNKFDSSLGRPLVSIVIPLFNHERYVAQTIRSLILQTYRNLELIVVDDGSSDDSVKIVEALRDECARRFGRFELLRQNNRGVSSALNRGIQAANGEFVFLIASDDVAEPGAIATFLDCMSTDPDVALVCGDVDMIDEAGHQCSLRRDEREFFSFIEYTTYQRTDVDIDRNFGSYESLINGNYLTVGTLLRKDPVLCVGGYDEDCAIEDLDLWLKLARRFKFRFVNKVLVHYRQHSRSTSQTRLESVVLSELRLLLREAAECDRRGIHEAWQTRIDCVLNWLLQRFAEYRAQVDRLACDSEAAQSELCGLRRREKILSDETAEKSLALRCALKEIEELRSTES